MIKAFIVFAALISGEAKEVKVDTQASTIIWEGTKVVGNGHTGTISLKSGSLDISTGKLKGGSFIIDMSTIVESEGSTRLEGHLKSDDFFGVERYPTAEFTTTKVKENNNGGYDVTGDITIKGKTESISFTAKLKETGGGYKVTASITIDRSKFDVQYGSGSFFDDLGDKAISDEFTLDVKLVAGN